MAAATKPIKSIAYDLSGVPVDIWIENGVSYYLKNGQKARVEQGWTISAGTKVYKMVGQSGVLVPNHNGLPPGISGSAVVTNPVTSGLQQIVDNAYNGTRQDTPTVGGSMSQADINAKYQVIGQLQDTPGTYRQQQSAAAGMGIDVNLVVQMVLLLSVFSLLKALIPRGK